ncbi:HlyD family secretion protein [Belliella kenyensis]|uniref:HlyD family secretion protein n=1 Tax=Belliella kenyensis TaxID=1472724 RepID=A0ABV8EK48_9BACT|nr:HlyD family efflux transporter periplasmic adaptor subunit [Belliella kenyensis]MCH7401290.1 HlyD family secretion protein [Belliella kenyensis]MDN3602735.1 HlyD family efflux transporter periplasmic adaptor subunit [Belliella kenyensis]
MKRDIFPQAIIQQSLEVYDARISVSSKTIYLLVLGILFTALIALPLIYVDVAVQARGTMQSALQRNSLNSSVGGRIDFWNLKENQKVKKGEVLALVRGEVLNLEMQGVEERLTVLDEFISDLHKLLQLDLSNYNMEPVALRSKFYQASILEYQTKFQNQDAAVQKLERDFERAQTLFDAKALAFADYDIADVQYKQAKSQLDLIRKQQRNLWEQDLVNYQNEKIRLTNQKSVFSEQMDQYRIIAGTNGTLINVLNLNEGDFVQPQQKIAEISPDTTLLAVSYISPMDIAFIEIGQEVTFQIDAYNYNQWGIATGKVVEVADDLSLFNEREAGFLVTCLLDSPFLTLPNGHEGQVKKGMTYNARFVVARRSLFQLLYDKVDNWINPQVQSLN